ncbi:MAG TPA: 4-hydroxythreonine-4-phosphate dehydrogenase PdxA [Gammaproteobacteria bacterium]|nr:4-hydroxythreonine-4-phosphate dehydrogenase PdxA [Gammaproteobacteria bacterium]
MSPRLAITPGEPAGIGPDLVICLAQRATLPAEMVILADPDLLLARARQLQLPLRIVEFDAARPHLAHLPGQIVVLPTRCHVPVHSGRPDAANAAYVLAALDRACDGCRDGTFDAMITGPVHKAIINNAGFAFSGHTEYLAARCGGPRPVMMLATPGLRVALATTHLPLNQVSAHINRAGLTEVIEILYRDLQRWFGIATPHLGICGLNPHAGEEGHLGREEIEVITPVLELLRQQGWRLDGPLPADTIFAPLRRQHYDAILAMYHDQGLTALKALGFGQAVNITLGLPILRTSVDHGTAFSLAGSGQADPGSLSAAVEMAAALARAARARSPGVATHASSASA